jgi:3-oxoacyl-[acyl-carrier-protein] synthase II
MRRRAAITGTGAVTSLGCDARTFVDRWIGGESGIVDGLSACHDFDPGAVMGRKEIRRSDRFTQLAIGATADALRDAGWDGGNPYEPERIACVYGTGVGGTATHEDNQDALKQRGPKAISALYVPMMMPNSAAGYLTLRHGWRGASFSVSSACATGGHALGIAVRMIESGEADAVVAGASDASLTPLSIGGFRAMEALSPTGRSLPFDARRDGFVMGEGAGTIVLEDMEAAEARGAQILGELLGYGTTTDAYHITAPDPDGGGAARAIELALADAELGPEDVDYVNAHGTGTELNDRVETLALKRALGATAGRIPVSSTKSVIGHLLGAAGVVEAVATVHALRRGVAPPTAGYKQPDDGLDLDYVPASRPLARRANGRAAVALSNSFGFGGHNAVVCLSGWAGG